MEDLGFSKPATLISFASPLVGDEMWQTAFQHLEKDRTVRHLRISVLEDYVPTTPISPPLDWGREFKHTGINLKLIGNSTCELKHSLGMTTRPIDGVTKWATKTLPWHTLAQYDARLDAVQDELRGMQLVDLYEDPEVLGDFTTFE
jgi:hypothetical protein